MANKYVKSLNFGGEDNYFTLPFVTGEQNGMVLKVVDGKWVASEIISEPVSPEPVIIEFTIFETLNYSTYTCRAIEGMTWAEWVASEYNTVGCYIANVHYENPEDEVICMKVDGTSGALVTYDGTDVTSDITVIEGYEYTW
jgi:hypothetical protein